MQSTLKFYPRLNLYKASNLTYNPETKIALSYNWYELYKEIKGVRCLNTFSYSPTTVKHIYELRRFFRYNSDIFDFEAPRGLQDLNAAIRYYEIEIERLSTLINTKGTRKTTNAKSFDLICEYNNIITKIKELRE